MRIRCAVAATAFLSALLVWASALGAAQSSADPDAILARIKADARARTRPPYVVYTLVRRDSLDGVPDFVNSYTLRIWCRTRDNAALARRRAGRGFEAPQYLVPAFDKPLDPGPPTADLLDVIRQTRGDPTPAPVAGALPVIGSVSVAVETHYAVTYAGTDHDDAHLRLEPRRDSDRNRLTDLYVDRSTYVLHRAVAHDHLYAGIRAIPERFEIVFDVRDGVPVIASIHGQTDYAALENRAADEPLHEVDYRFEDVSFPAELPDWYFDPAEYGAHRGEAPD